MRGVTEIWDIIASVLNNYDTLHVIKSQQLGVQSSLVIDMFDVDDDVWLRKLDQVPA